MNNISKTDILSLRVYQTACHVCNYLPDQTACSQVVFPAAAMSTHVYSRLVHLGFRRSGFFVYRPACEHCERCISIRLPVAHFKPQRYQRRAYKKCQHLKVQVCELCDLDEHYELYCKYQLSRHTLQEDNAVHRAQYRDFLACSYVNTKLVEFREPALNAQEKGELKMVSVIDMLDDGVSAVYTFYDPQNTHASYGTYGILWQVQYVQTLNLPYVYLGYWIQECRKMAYKTRFRPFEFLSAKGWQ